MGGPMMSGPGMLPPVDCIVYDGGADAVQAASAIAASAATMPPTARFAMRGIA